MADLKIHLVKYLWAKGSKAVALKKAKDGYTFFVSYQYELNNEK